MASRRKVKRNDNNLAVAYFRYSSSSQNEASIDQQREAAFEYADRKGLQIVRTYQDAAMSGLNAARPGYQQMISEVRDLKPSTLILWKNDRLGRDRGELHAAKDLLYRAGCHIECVAEASPDMATAMGQLNDALSDALAEFYSNQLSENITRGLDYNARYALYNGVKILGYVGKPGEPYEIDDLTAPIVRRIFHEYADGVPMQDIVDTLNEAGCRSTRGNKFTINSLRRILTNEAYIGVYKYGEHRIPGGMPALVTPEEFAEAQKMLELNKRRVGRYVKAEQPDKELRYWLTGRAFCGVCGGEMHGMSGTSKTGAKYGYYACKAQRKKKCSAKPVRREALEGFVRHALEMILDNTENIASLAVDFAKDFEAKHKDDSYLRSLEAEHKETLKALENLVKALEMGFFSETTQERLHELENRKRSLADAIEVEKAKAALAANQQGVKAFYERFLKANLDDLSVREALTEYFLDKVVYEPGKVTIYGNYYDSPPDGLFSPLTLELKDKDCVPEDVLALEGGDALDFRAAECDVQGFSHFALRSTTCRV